MIIALTSTSFSYETFTNKVSFKDTVNRKIEMYRFTIDVKIVSKKFTVKLQAKMSCESEQVLSQ